MRLWSVHPQHLDTKGLVALWREALLAKHVLQGKTKGYRHHPQLIRFREAVHQVHAINQYLAAVHEQAMARGYNFDGRKINWNFKATIINVTRGQMDYETQHLLKKLRSRDPVLYRKLRQLPRLASHPMFKVVGGGVEAWEIV